MQESRKAKYYNFLMDCPEASAVIANGGEWIDVAMLLHDQKKQLIEKILKLDSICPRKIINKAGVEYVWTIPADLIPEERVIRE